MIKANTQMIFTDECMRICTHSYHDEALNFTGVERTKQKHWN